MNHIEFDEIQELINEKYKVGTSTQLNIERQFEEYNRRPIL